jgi:VIT1/CCC1 family predicted Fe2+/Mn2+ transporter
MIPNIHSEKHFEGSAALRDIVIGMSDGLTVPFALAAGLSGASVANSVIVTAGVAELVAGAISMGLGGYLAGRSEVEHYESERKREVYEINKIPKAEKQEIRDILERFGITPETQQRFVDDLAKDKKNWLEFMMEFELGLRQPEPSLVKWTALRVGLSYAIGGLVPLSAYFLTRSPGEGLIFSSVLTIVALAFFGYFKSRFLNQPRFKGVIRMIIVGALAAGVSFFVARAII